MSNISIRIRGNICMTNVSAFRAQVEKRICSQKKKWMSRIQGTLAKIGAKERVSRRAMSVKDSVSATFAESEFQTNE